MIGVATLDRRQRITGSPSQLRWSIANPTVIDEQYTNRYSTPGTCQDNTSIKTTV
jgi:hypothetical protein